MSDILIIIILILSLISVVIALICFIKLSRLKSQDNLEKNINNIRSELNIRFDNIQSALMQSQAVQYDRVSQDIQRSLKSFSDQISTLNTSMDLRMTDLRKTQDDRLEAVRQTMETRITAMQADNQKKLDEIRGVVDEKIQKTINERMTESFKIVNDRLEAVYKGLGEMNTLATGVGDLKRILSNVKTRGIFGEVQLDRILEQILTPEQYAKDIATIPGSHDRVEFAIKIPSKDNDGSFIYMPIDSKFPMDKYENLVDASENADLQKIDSARKDLCTFIKISAKTIHEKYIHIPDTTAFAILFLPTEGLYAEVVKDVELFEYISKHYQITVAGPSTISALLNSLQMGFRTLAIQKRSNEVWNLLGAVKTEFDKFSKTLDEAQSYLNKADSKLSDLIGTRTRLIKSKLKKVQQLPESESSQILSDDNQNNEEVVNS